MTKFEQFLSTVKSSVVHPKLRVAVLLTGDSASRLGLTQQATVLNGLALIRVNYLQQSVYLLADGSTERFE